MTAQLATNSNSLYATNQPNVDPEHYFLAGKMARLDDGSYADGWYQEYGIKGGQHSTIM